MSSIKAISQTWNYTLYTISEVWVYWCFAVFAWEAYERGADVHLQADPTKLELLSREVDKRKDDFKTSAKDSILARYGGEEHLEAPPKQLLMAQTVSGECYRFLS